MNRVEFMRNLADVSIVTQIIKLYFIIMFSYYVFSKVINIKQTNKKILFFSLLSSMIISICTIKVKSEIDSYFSSLILIILLVLVNRVNFKKNIIDTIVISIISFGISYLIFMISVSIAFIPGAIFKIDNDYIALAIILTFYFLLMYKTFKIRKIKNGIAFLQKKVEDTFFNILILNIGIMIIFLFMIIEDNLIIKMRKPLILFIMLSVSMFITIKQSFDLYYKQNLLNKDLEETKQELENKTKDVERLEKEILKSSKARHSLVHRQEVLQYQLDELMNMSSNSKEDKSKLREELESISKEVYKNPEKVELTKTGILSIDKRLEYMQSQCIKNNIEFELQVIDNIHHMKNYLIEEKDLEMLLADHIKDAIIAINSSDNDNRSILVRIGKIDGVYSLYIYDSGIEFTKEVLEKLGKEPITTHRDNGGTGMGFMNTFDTLNKTKASLIINQIGPPRLDNYTKAVIFKFDNKNEFWVKSYNEEMAFKS